MSTIQVTGTLHPDDAHRDDTHEMGLSESGFEHYSLEMSYVGLPGPEFTTGTEAGTVRFAVTYEPDENYLDSDDPTGVTQAGFQTLSDSLMSLGAQDTLVTQVTQESNR